MDPDAENGSDPNKEATESSVGGDQGPPFRELMRGEEVGAGALNEPELVRGSEGVEGAAAEAEAAEITWLEMDGQDEENVIREREKQARTTRIDALTDGRSRRWFGHVRARSGRQNSKFRMMCREREGGIWELEIEGSPISIKNDMKFANLVDFSRCHFRMLTGKFISFTLS